VKSTIAEALGDRKGQESVINSLKTAIEVLKESTLKFETATEKYKEEIANFEKKATLKELQDFAYIAQEELDAKEKLLLLYKKQLKDLAVVSKTHKPASEGLINLLIKENELLREKIMSQEKSFLTQKASFKKQIEALKEGILGSKCQVNNQSLADMIQATQEEIKKLITILSKRSKKSGEVDDKEFIIRNFDKLFTEIKQIRAYIDKAWLKQTLDQHRQLYEELAKLRKDQPATSGASSDNQKLTTEALNELKSLANQLASNQNRDEAANRLFDKLGGELAQLTSKVTSCLAELNSQLKEKEIINLEFSKEVEEMKKDQKKQFSKKNKDLYTISEAVRSTFEHFNKTLNDFFERPIVEIREAVQQLREAVSIQKEATLFFEQNEAGLKQLNAEVSLGTKKIIKLLESEDLDEIIRHLNNIVDNLS